ncbi:TPA: hypothetical protein ACH3X2_011849 [Trebouxia sp. C0005]
MVAFGHEKELVNHYHVKHGCSIKASRRRVEQELAASVEMPVDSRSLDNHARHGNSSAVQEAGRSHDHPCIAVSASTCAAFADPHWQAAAQSAVELQLAQVKLPGYRAEAVQQLEAAASAHAPPAVLQASRNLLPAPPSLTWRASIASSADAHTGDIVRDMRESAQASPKQALLARASPPAIILRRPVPGMKASLGRLTQPRSLHHRPDSSADSASGAAGRQQQPSSLHGFGTTQQLPEALPRQPRIATVPSTDPRHLKPSESMSKAQPEREWLFLSAGAPAAIVGPDKYGAASMHLQNSAAHSSQLCAPQASSTAPAKSLTIQLSAHQDFGASSIPHADVLPEAVQHGPFAAVVRVDDVEPGNFAPENVAKPGDLHHQPFGVPGIESWNTSLSEPNVHHRDLNQYHTSLLWTASGSITPETISSVIPDTGGSAPKMVLPPKPQPQPRVKISRPDEVLPPKP